MELLEIYKKTKEKAQEYADIKKSMEFDYEFRKLVSAIVEGKEYFLSNNERLFTKLGIKHRKGIHTEITPYGIEQGFKLKITEKVVKKVEEYMSK